MTWVLLAAMVAMSAIVMLQINEMWRLVRTRHVELGHWVRKRQLALMTIGTWQLVVAGLVLTLGTWVTALPLVLMGALMLGLSRVRTI